MSITKPAQIPAKPNKTDYIGALHLDKGNLDFMMHPEGQYDFGSDQYHFNLTDHLGNVRIVVNEAGTVLQRQDYYSFGLTFNSSGTKNNKHIYNGRSEWTEDIGMDIYFSRNRMFDPALGRFWGIDAMADMFSSMTPMAYGYNNPIKFNDPLGLFGCEDGEDCDEEPRDDGMLNEVVVTAKDLSNRPKSRSGSVDLSDFINSSNPVYRNAGMQIERGNTNFVQNALNKTIHYSSGEALQYGESEYTQMFGSIMFYGVGGSMIVMVGSPVLMEMLLADGSGNIAREATTQIVFSLAIHGDLSGVDVLDIGLAGLGTIPSVLLQSTFDYTQNSGLETTFGIGTKFEKSISSSLIDASVGSLNGTLARQMNKAKVDEIVIGVMNNFAAPARQGIGITAKNRYE